MMRNASILGMLPGNAPQLLKDKIHASLYSELKSGALRPFVGRELQLAEAPEAHRLVMKPGALGKIILVNR
jgi:NADPH2:quinone reductase